MWLSREPLVKQGGIQPTRGEIDARSDLMKNQRELSLFDILNGYDHHHNVPFHSLYQEQTWPRPEEGF